jgi:hypothetical protein
MENQVEKFDPSTLMQGVKDRIKATFVSLIPETQWEVMVQKEIDAFFNSEETLIFAKKDEQISGQWHAKKLATLEIKQSPFRALVWEHCTNMTTQILKEKITKEYFNEAWPATEETIDEKMKSFVKDAIPNAISLFFENIAFRQVEFLRQQIQQGR